MYYLKDKNKQIPNGYRFRQPETKWVAPPFQSFNSLCQLVINHRQGNPFLIQKHGWATDMESVAQEVEAYQVKLCLVNGWTNYLLGDGDGPVPKHSAPTSLRAKSGVASLVVGALTLKEMFGPEARPVAKELATQRAVVCAACPMNDTGDWTRLFTRPAAEMIRKTLASLKDMDLTTPHDDKLRVCIACECPLRLKIHVPIDHITKHMREEDRKALHTDCWILNEIKGIDSKLVQ